MSTIDLGKIKMVWRGAYNNATAYTIDDAVSLNGTSYICIAATTGNTPPNATYWNVMAQGGTDLGATLSNNQIAIKNNSGNIAGVNIGTAGQVFKVNSSANGYEFGTDAGGGMLQAVHKADGSTNYATVIVTGNSFTSATEFMSMTITPSATSSYILVNGMFHLHHTGSYEGYWWLTYQIAGGSEQMIAGNSQTGKRRTGRVSSGGDSTSNMTGSQIGCVMFAPNTTSAITIRLRGATSTSGHGVAFNRDISNSTNTADGGSALSTMTAFEIAGSISPSITDNSVYRGT